MMWWRRLYWAWVMLSAPAKRLTATPGQAETICQEDHEPVIPETLTVGDTLWYGGQVRRVTRICRTKGHKLFHLAWPE